MSEKEQKTSFIDDLTDRDLRKLFEMLANRSDKDLAFLGRRIAAATKREQEKNAEIDYDDGKIMKVIRC